jgi:hypothetical protein
MMAGVQAGDATALRTFFKYASDPAQAEEMLKNKSPHIYNAKDGSQESIQLGNAGIAARDSRFVGTLVDKPPQSAYTLTNEIDTHIKNGTLDTPMEGRLEPVLINGRQVRDSNGQIKMRQVRETVGDHDMTYREGLIRRLNERRSVMNPSGIKMVESRLAAYDVKKTEAAEVARVEAEDLAEKQAMAEGRMKAKYGEPLETSVREILRQQRAEEKAARRDRFYPEKTDEDATDKYTQRQNEFRARYPVKPEPNAFWDWMRQ